MTVDCIIDDPRWTELALTDLAVQATNATLERLGLEPSVFEISLLACDDVKIAGLNADFRNKDKATNVLSWPSAERAAQTPGEMPVMPAPGPESELGDIAIAYETCAREAAEQSKPMAAHVTHLLVHGTLHLLGFDHENSPDAALMEGLEVEILGKLGLSDPYYDESA
ncbi:MAG: rRNA maturation RNase YbeY [Pseudomonadota bacterium]